MPLESRNLIIKVRVSHAVQMPMIGIFQSTRKELYFKELGQGWVGLWYGTSGITDISGIRYLRSDVKDTNVYI